MINFIMNILYEVEVMSATNNSFAAIAIGVFAMELKRRTVKVMA